MEQQRPERVINILDDDTANKIAAGEVVERPASVVKELIENALDAGADEIKVEIEDGGKKLIRVTDNGIGMSRDDAVMALKRHSTSKIRSPDDLFSIRTLGFRGEALPSIASVSRLEITTRRDGDECGTKVVCAGGEILEVSDTGAPVGTSVGAGELFYNLPARRKFLRTAQTELGHISDLVGRFAMSHYEVDVKLAHNGRMVFQAMGSNRAHDALLTVFGRDAAEAAIAILGQSGPYKIHGFVSRPSYSKANRSGQLFFVNRRYVRSRSLTHAVDEAYRGILPQGRFPLLIAFVELEPHLVDVNVHPTKIEIKFTRDWEVHNLLVTSIRDALSSSAVLPDGLDAIPVAATSIPKSPFGSSHARPATETTAASSEDLERFREALRDRREQTVPAADIPVAPSAAAVEPDAAAPERTDLLGGACVAGQARGLYILAESPSGILLIDQHVAHERIIYDRLANSREQISVQRLMMPLTLTLGHREALVLEDKLDEMRSLGFEIDPFGRDTFLVRSIPAMVAEKNSEEILRDTVEELAELTSARRLVVHREMILATTACKMAVKAGEKLSMEEMARLVADLRKTTNPYLCPHGRPIVVCLTNRELDKLFGRA